MNFVKLKDTLDDKIIIYNNSLQNIFIFLSVIVSLSLKGYNPFPRSLSATLNISCMMTNFPTSSTSIVINQ